MKKGTKKKTPINKLKDFAIKAYVKVTNIMLERFPSIIFKIKIVLDILVWVFGFSFGIGGVRAILHGRLAIGVPLFLTSLILLPGLDKLVKDKYGHKIPRLLKIILFLIFTGLWIKNSNVIDKMAEAVQASPE